MLVDSHCHLDFPEFAGELDAVVARARAAGVGAMVTISTILDRFPRLQEIARAHDGVYCTVGVHPHEAKDHPDLAAGDLVALCGHEDVVGIGETGLDYHYEHSPRDAQQRSFRAHIAAARETGLPLIVHTRAADGDTIAILADEMGKGPFQGLIHCFSTSRELAENAIENGFYVSISGIVTFKNAGDIRATVRDLPLERLLVETDAPYLAPAPERGRRNEPALLVHTAAKVADLKGIELDELARATTDNFFSLFARAKRPGGAMKIAAQVVVSPCP